MTVNPDTLRLARGMRLDLSAVVDEQVRATVKAWAVAWSELAGAWDAAIADLVAASQDGQWPSRGQVLRAERVLRAMEVSRAKLDELARDAGARVIESLPETTAAAAEWEARLVASQMPAQAGDQATLAAGFNRVDGTALDAIVQRTTQQVTALTLPLSTQATQAMNAVLIRGVALGDNPRTAARLMVQRVEGAFNGGLTRALVISRTEMLDAHRQAARAQDLANLDVVTGWQWLAQMDNRTCPSCLAMSGTTHAPDESGPDDHQQGRCARIPLTKTWREMGFNLDEPESVMPDARAWFDEQPAATRLAIMGRDRLDLLDSGKIGWSDLAQQRHTQGWRDSWAPTPVRDLRARAAA